MISVCLKCWAVELNSSRSFLNWLPSLTLVLNWIDLANSKWNTPWMCTKTAMFFNYRVPFFLAELINFCKPRVVDKHKMPKSCLKLEKHSRSRNRTNTGKRKKCYISAGQSSLGRAYWCSWRNTRDTWGERKIKNVFLTLFSRPTQMVRERSWEQGWKLKIKKIRGSYVGKPKQRNGNLITRTILHWSPVVFGNRPRDRWVTMVVGNYCL